MTKKKPRGRPFTRGHDPRRTGLPLVAEGATCPACNVGTMQKREGQYGEFLGCTHFPACHHTQRADVPIVTGDGVATTNNSTTTSDSQQGEEMQETATGSVDAIIAAIARKAAGESVNEKRVREIVAEAMAEQSGVTVIRVDRQEGDTVKSTGNIVTHRRFPALLQALQARQFNGQPLNVWLVGPPGTGKTTAAEQVGEQLGLPVYLFSNIATAYDLTGGRNVQGEYIRTQFRECVEHGGIAVFDEITGNDPQALLFINSFLANGIVAFPDGIVRRHPRCYVIAGDQTRGAGSTSRYVSRNRMDAATLSRFVFIDWEIDPSLEERMAAGNTKWLNIVRKVRENVRRNGVDVDITPRNTAYGAALLAAGFSMEETKNMALRGSLADAVWSKVSA